MSHTTPFGELSDRINDAKHKITVGGTYYHWRIPTQHYQVLDIGLLESNEQVAVIYQRIDPENPIIWVRPVHGEDGWLTPVQHEGAEIARFHLVEP